jgi:drug/metabolite transporter, DME family
MTPHTKGILIALLGTTAWATTAIFISYLYNHFVILPLTLAFWRDLLVGVALFLVLLVKRPHWLRLTRRDVFFFLGYGSVALALFNGAWSFSVKFNGAAVATVLAYSSPAFTLLLARPWLKEPITGRKWIAVLLSLTGCVLVVRAYTAETWQVNGLGLLAGLVTGLCFAVYNLAGRWSAKRFPQAWTVTTYGFLFAAATLGLSQRPETLFTLGPAWEGWLILIILALGPTILGYGLYTVSLRYLPASTAGLIASLEPALTAVMAVFILGETLDGWQWLGAGLIVVAVLVVQREVRPSETPQPDERPSPPSD